MMIHHRANIGYSVVAYVGTIPDAAHLEIRDFHATCDLWGNDRWYMKSFVFKKASNATAQPIEKSWIPIAMDDISTKSSKKKNKDMAMDQYL